MSNEGRICPQCSYQRQPKDLAPDYECPRCGIIYAKYRPPEPKPAPPAPANAFRGGPTTPIPSEEPAPGENSGEIQTPADDEDQPLPPASPLIRTFAGIHTFGKVVLYFVPVKLFVYGVIRTWYPPESIKGFGLPFNKDYFEMAYYGYLVLLIIYAFLFQPWLDGRSWGQSKFSLAVRPRDDQEGSLSFKDYLLRFAGHFLAWTTWPVTLVGFFYNLFAKRNDPGIADRISGTRQYETEKPLPFRAGLAKAFFPLCLAMLIQVAVVGPLCVWIMKDYFKPVRSSQSFKEAAEQARQDNYRKTQENVSRQMELVYGEQSGSTMPGEAPPKSEMQAGPVAKPPAGIAEQRKTVGGYRSISILSEMEKSHLRDQGSFTEELDALVARYGTDPAETAELQSLISEGTLRARKTTQGVEIWSQNPAGQWIYREVRR